MIKQLIFWFSILFVSCGIKKHTNTSVSTSNDDAIKVEMSFTDCDSLCAFLANLIVDGKKDKSLKAGQFKLPYIIPSFEHAKSLFPEKCFIGMTDEELKKIFGNWDYGGKSENHPAWYVLQSRSDELAIEVFIVEGKVEKFKVSQSSVQN